MTQKPTVHNNARLQALHAYANALDAANKAGMDQVLQVMRELSLNDLFFLLHHMFMRDDVNRDWIFARCREVQANPDGYLDLWARDHYKSSLITYALTIQEILRKPDITIGIFSHTRPIAKSFLRQIKREFEENPRLKAVFPDVLYMEPQKQSPKWSEDEGIVVRRKTNPKEATVEAWGLVDGQPIGKHFELMVYDDVVTLDSVNTPEMIKKTTMAWAMSRNLASGDNPRTRYIGTRYHFADTYRDIIERGAGKPRIYPATEDGTPTGRAVLLTQESLERKRKEMGPHVFSSQMLQDPRADEVQGFQEAWLRYWEPKDWWGMNRYILVDPATEKKQGSDYTAIFVVGLGDDGNYYVIDMFRDRLSLTERARKLFELHREYDPLVVGYEKYGMQSDIEHFQDKMDRENYRFNIMALGGRIKKNDRIRKLIPLFEQGRIYIPKEVIRVNYEGRMVDMTRAFVEEEFKFFPAATHDDMLDSLARILDPDLGAIAPKSSGFRARSSSRSSAAMGYAPRQGGARSQSVRIKRRRSPANGYWS